MLGILLAAALASASPAPGHCLDSFLAVGQPIAPPRGAWNTRKATEWSASTC